jgi:hypothetical protein
MDNGNNFLPIVTLCDFFGANCAKTRAVPNEEPDLFYLRLMTSNLRKFCLINNGYIPSKKKKEKKGKKKNTRMLRYLPLHLLRILVLTPLQARIPVCVWKHSTTHATISRCSQPLVGIGRRNEEDEALFREIQQANEDAKGKTLYIVDARPKVQNKIQY